MAQLEVHEVNIHVFPLYINNVINDVNEIKILGKQQTLSIVYDLYLWGMLRGFLKDRPELPTKPVDRLQLHLLSYLMKYEQLPLDEAKNRVHAAKDSVAKRRNQILQELVNRGEAAWRDKPAAKAQEQAGYDAGKQFMETVSTHVKEKMPAICDWYIDLLVQRVKEAQDDPELIRLAWEGFKAALQDVPRIVEESIRQQYAVGWDAFKGAGVDHILSGIIKQEAAAFTDPLPDRLLGQITSSRSS